MRLIKVIFACGLLAMLVVAGLKAQTPAAPVPAVQPAQGVSTPTAASAPAKAEEAAEAIPQAAPPLFTVLGFPVTNSMVCTWIVAALIFVIVRATTWKLKEIPTGGQNVMETLVEGWEGLMGNILEPKVTRWVFPFATTFFIFIVISNFVDLIPGVGSIGVSTPGQHPSFRPFFRPPTTDANLTVAMAGIFLVMNLFWAVRYNGFWGLIKHIFGVKMETNKWVYPLFLLLFIFVGLMEVLSIVVVRPVALAMRLYGNIFGGENMLDMMLSHKSFPLAVISALPFYFYEVFVCALQAFVFALLTIAFVGTICTHADEAH
jgi:F-type H+-transporting ATPase subunit a